MSSGVGAACHGILVFVDPPLGGFALRVYLDPLL